MRPIRKREGFEGQRAIVLPKKILELSADMPPVSALYVTDLGFYPRANHHYRERPHGISQHILIYCLEGKGWLEVPNGKFEVNPNEFLLIPADMPHKYGADEKNPWTIHWAHFKGAQSPYFASLLTHQNKTFVNYTPFLEERIQVFDSIYRALEGGYSPDNLVYSNVAFTYFLASLNFADKVAPVQHQAAKDAVDRSIEYMQNHLDKALTLESIASEINLSVSHYSNVFRKKTGYSPVVYFNHLKIQHACRYLQFTTLRINEIATKLGIEDPYYFSRMFTKLMGISPVEYRNRKH
jgi:AraC-like DNA-binding protein/mannose-6-phosphate isomerase-like protein (cupin superfamily)